MAKQGVLEAQYCMGRIYHKGECVTKSNEKALGWLIKAVEKKHADSLRYLHSMAYENIPKAQFILGAIYEHGVFVRKNITSAIGYYECAEKNGHPSAKMHLANARETQRLEEIKHQDFLREQERERREIDAGWERLRRDIRSNRRP